jgi:hypothetical protein
MFSAPPTITATRRASAGYRPSAGFANSDISPVRHYCRNPRCRSKLKEPVSNPHKAFCTKGCYGSFYLRRCAVCENNKPDGSTARRILCRRPNCESRYRQNRDLYSYPGGDSARTANGSRNSIKPGTKSRIVDDLPWRIAAGPKPNLRGATVGAEGVIEANNRANAKFWHEHNAKAEAACLIKRQSPPVNIVGGYKFPNVLVVDLPPVKDAPAALSSDLNQISDDLVIPAFLRKVP